MTYWVEDAINGPALKMFMLDHGIVASINNHFCVDVQRMESACQMPHNASTTLAAGEVICVAIFGQV